MDIQTSKHTDGCTDIHTHPPYTSQILGLQLTHICKEFYLFKANFPTPKETGNLLENLQTTLGTRGHMAYGTAERICFCSSLRTFLTWLDIVYLQDCILILLQNVISNV